MSYTVAKSLHDRWTDKGRPHIFLGNPMGPFWKFPKFLSGRIAAVFCLVLLTTASLSTPVSADTVGAGISAGAAKACPSAGCTCMPENQAETLGYVRCSASETPCFHDSFGRPLYCYGPFLCDSPSGCNTSSSESQAGSTGAGGIKLVITMQTPVAGDTSCAGTDSDVCMVPGATTTTTTPVPAATDPITVIIDFFKSLFVMK